MLTQWNEADRAWVKIGEVVNAVGSARRQVYNGKEYDYVFDVDIYDGAPPLKLPYNNSENPYEVAQEFIHKHELPQDYLDQIANFIMQNAKNVVLGEKQQVSAADPFTGAFTSYLGSSRYVASDSGYKSPLIPQVLLFHPE
jgi:phospholipase A-2-activating protein